MSPVRMFDMSLSFGFYRCVREASITLGFTGKKAFSRIAVQHLLMTGYGSANVAAALTLQKARYSGKKNAARSRRLSSRHRAGKSSFSSTLRRLRPRLHAHETGIRTQIEMVLPSECLA